ncbi:hypothetical protein BDZ45DRAFT_97571, partial [Acephala macrosclerotiorum]
QASKRKSFHYRTPKIVSCYHKSSSFSGLSYSSPAASAAFQNFSILPNPVLLVHLLIHPSPASLFLLLLLRSTFPLFALPADLGLLGSEKSLLSSIVLELLGHCGIDTLRRCHSTLILQPLRNCRCLRLLLHLLQELRRPCWLGPSHVRYTAAAIAGARPNRREKGKMFVPVTLLLSVSFTDCSIDAVEELKLFRSMR